MDEDKFWGGSCEVSLNCYAVAYTTKCRSELDTSSRIITGLEDLWNCWKCQGWRTGKSRAFHHRANGQPGRLTSSVVNLPARVTWSMVMQVVVLLLILIVTMRNDHCTLTLCWGLL